MFFLRCEFFWWCRCVCQYLSMKKGGRSRLSSFRYLC
jgi:hypothetical protein